MLSPARRPARRLAIAAVCFALLTLAGDRPALAGRGVIINLTETLWIFSGSYKVKAKRTGLGNDQYALQFIVDLFQDTGQNFFTLQCLPIVEGMEDEFFSGTWLQDGAKLSLSFDAFSQQLLIDQFEADLTLQLGAPVDVFLRQWEITAKTRADDTGAVFLEFKEKLGHTAYYDGIPIKMRTRGKGTADLAP